MLHGTCSGQRSLQPSWGRWTWQLLTLHKCRGSPSKILFSSHPCSQGHLPQEMLVLQDQKKKKNILKSLHNPSNECNQGHAATNGSLPTNQCIEVRLYSSSSMETLIFKQWHSEQPLLAHILQHSRKKTLLWGWVCFFFYSAGETRTNCSIWKVILGPSTPARGKRTALKAREVCLCIDTRAVGATAHPKSACRAEASRMR